MNNINNLLYESEESEAEFEPKENVNNEKVIEDVIEDIQQNLQNLEDEAYNEEVIETELFHVNPNENEPVEPDSYPHMCRLIFPAASGIKSFAYNSKCGIPSEDMDKWISENLNDQPPPHWRDHPRARQVKQKFITGDPIEEFRGQSRTEFRVNANVQRRAIVLPSDYVTRVYPDYI